MPITPPPTTVMARGTRSRLMIFIAGDDPRMIVAYPRWGGGNGADGDEDVLGLNPLQGLLRHDLDRLGVEKRGFAPNDPDVIPLELSFDHVPFSFNDLVHPRKQLIDPGSGRQSQPMPFTKLFGLPAKGQDGFPKGLTGDGSRIQTASPRGLTLLDYGHALAQLCRLHRGSLACRSASDAKEIHLQHVMDGFLACSPRGLSALDSFSMTLHYGAILFGILIISILVP